MQKTEFPKVVIFSFLTMISSSSDAMEKGKSTHTGLRPGSLSGPVYHYQAAVNPSPHTREFLISQIREADQSLKTLIRHRIQNKKAVLNKLIQIAKGFTEYDAELIATLPGDQIATLFRTLTDKVMHTRTNGLPEHFNNTKRKQSISTVKHLTDVIIRHNLLLRENWQTKDIYKVKDAIKHLPKETEWTTTYIEKLDEAIRKKKLSPERGRQSQARRTPTNRAGPAPSQSINQTTSQLEHTMGSITHQVSNLSITPNDQQATRKPQGATKKNRPYLPEKPTQRLSAKQSMIGKAWPNTLLKELEEYKKTETLWNIKKSLNTSKHWKWDQIIRVIKFATENSLELHATAAIWTTLSYRIHPASMSEVPSDGLKKHLNGSPEARRDTTETASLASLQMTDITIENIKVLATEYVKSCSSYSTDTDQLVILFLANAISQKKMEKLNTKVPTHQQLETIDELKSAERAILDTIDIDSLDVWDEVNLQALKKFIKQTFKSLEPKTEAIKSSVNRLLAPAF